MKYGAIICTIIFSLAILLAVAQLWLGILDTGVFWKLQLTLGGFFILALGITLVTKEYLSDKELKKGKFLE